MKELSDIDKRKMELADSIIKTSDVIKTVCTINDGGDTMIHTHLLNIRYTLERVLKRLKNSLDLYDD